jgi:hypothetical protein
MDLLKHIIAVISEDPIRGRYGFRFYQHGEWKTIIIDDRLPCDENKNLIFAKSRDRNELWVSLIEKAYAKLNGSYGALISGFTRNALVDMTGGVGSAINTKQFKSSQVDELWGQLCQYTQERNVLLACSIIQKEGDAIVVNGLLTGHAYAILKCVELNGHKLLHIRNRKKFSTNF